MTDPALVPAGALKGISVGISVSDSADLPRLGLTSRHCDIAIAELARAILIAGGNVVYGGRLVDAGFTGVLLDEVRQYGDAREALTICLAETELRKLTDEELHDEQRKLAASAAIVCLDGNGDEIDWRNRPAAKPVDPADALTGLRRHVTSRCAARVVVGGQLRGYEGRMPGVIEEAMLSLAKRQPLYVAGGFGGAAAAVSRVLGRDDPTFAPADFPGGADEERDALEALAEAAATAGLAVDGLSDDERRQLAMTHRPTDIASLAVLGLARSLGRS